MAIQVDGSKQPFLASDQKVAPGAHGQNGPQPSSVKVTDSCDLSALKVTAPNDTALDLVRGDHHHSILSDDADSWQRRKISDNQMATTHGMHPPSGSPSGNIGPVTRPVKK